MLHNWRPTLRGWPLFLYFCPVKLRLLLLLLPLSLGPLRAAEPRAERVVFVGIDGLASWCLERAQDIPNLRSLMAEGAWTLRKRSVMPSSSAVNWASVFMGVPTEMHAFNKWNARRPALPAVAAGQGGTPPTLFTLLRVQRPGAVSLAWYNWSGIGAIIDTASVSVKRYAPARPGLTTSDYTRQAAEEIVSLRPELAFLYYEELDAVGHASGWGSADYYATLSQLDACIGQLVRALKDADLWEGTLLVISSDHGGKGKRHGGFTLEELEAPFLVAGTPVRRLGSFPQAMVQYDIAATLAWALGLEIPEHWRGRPLVEIFSN